MRLVLCLLILICERINNLMKNINKYKNIRMVVIKVVKVRWNFWNCFNI